MIKERRNDFEKGGIQVFENLTNSLIRWNIKIED